MPTVNSVLYTLEFAERLDLMLNNSITKNNKRGPEEMFGGDGYIYGTSCDDDFMEMDKYGFPISSNCMH